jgi:hypothetical protein
MTIIKALHRKFVAVAAASLLAGGASPAKAAYLGIVIHAERAHLGEATASVGSTIFGGEKLSTDAGGLLRIAIPALTLQLGDGSSLVLSDTAGPQGSILAELASGTLIFSAAATGSIAIAADDGLVRPVADTATVPHIRVVTQKELRIYAQRGSLEFSYHGESETIPEGKSYRVILDSSEKEVAANSGPEQAGQAKKNPQGIIQRLSSSRLPLRREWRWPSLCLRDPTRVLTAQGRAR